MNKTLARTMGRIDKALAKAMQIILTEIEKEARKAIEANPDKVKSFCMATGNVSFHVVWLESCEGGPVPRDEHVKPSEFEKYGLISTHAGSIAKLLDEYNRMLRLTGFPMKIERDHTGELIKINEW